MGDFVNLSFAFLKFVAGVMLKITLFCFSYTKKLLKKTYEFLNNSLTKNQLCWLIGGLAFFIYSDRRMNKNIVYDKSRSPNILWTLFVLYLYMFSWIDIILTPWMFVAERTEYLNLIFNREFVEGVLDFFDFRQSVELFFWNNLSFMAVYHLMLYYIPRLMVRFIPAKFIYLPMYFRYHSMVNSLSAVFLVGVDTTFKKVAGIIFDAYRHSDYLEVTSKDEKTVITMSIFILIFYAVTLGNWTWQAARGKSFGNHRSSFDKFIRTHLASDSLYPDEKWEDFGIDDL